jgi:hypothetical protein
MSHRRNRTILRLAAAALFGLSGAALAAPSVAAPLVVVELFTSQGCSSCPPADAVLLDLARRDDVVALAWHVDYWDRLGWRDPFASRWATERQYNYAASLGRPNVYTPQMVIAGTRDVVGSRRFEVEAAILTAQESGNPVIPLTLSATETELQISAGAGAGAGTGAIGLDAEVRLLLVRYQPRRETSVRAGENDGRTLVEANIVTEAVVLGRWQGQAMTLSAPRTPGLGHAVLLQQMQGDRPGRILAAAKLDVSATAAGL